MRRAEVEGRTERGRVECSGLAAKYACDPEQLITGARPGGRGSSVIPGDLPPDQALDIIGEGAQVRIGERAPTHTVLPIN